MEKQKRWDVLSRLIKENDLKVGVEIGAKAGENIKHILSACSDVIIYGIDCWDPNFKYQTWSKGLQSVNEKKFNDVAIKFPGRAVKVKMWSNQAVGHFPDNSIDFVFIDGNHDFESVYYDITFWLPKVRKGGFITGHDYGHPKIGNVKGAVDVLFPTDVFLFDDYVWVKKK